MNTKLGWLSAALSAALAWAAHGQVTLQPAEMTFRSQAETHTVNVFHNGSPVSANQIGPVKVYVDQHDYDEMFQVRRADGRISLTPTSQIEMGRYDLVVVTPHGRGRGTINVTLSDDPETLENRAKARGMTVDELLQSMGLTQSAGREGLRIDAAPQYYLGQTVRIEMTPPPIREYAWYLNGELVSSGSGPSVFEHTFRRTGTHNVRYEERQNGAIVADTEMRTEVVEEPPVPWEVPVGVQVTVPGPTDFSEYSWRVNGEPISTQRVLRHTFSNPGQYTLECEATSPEPLNKYRKITYAVTAR